MAPRGPQVESKWLQRAPIWLGLAPRWLLKAPMCDHEGGELVSKCDMLRFQEIQPSLMFFNKNHSLEVNMGHFDVQKCNPNCKNWYIAMKIIKNQCWASSKRSRSAPERLGSTQKHQKWLWTSEFDVLQRQTEG